MPVRTVSGYHAEAALVLSASSRLLLTVQWQKQETQAAKLNATIAVRLAHLEYKERTEKSDEFGQLM